jgi:hypothetical protein
MSDKIIIPITIWKKIESESNNMTYKNLKKIMGLSYNLKWDYDKDISVFKIEDERKLMIFRLQYGF